MWSHFSSIYGDGKVTSVGKKIGGKVQYNIELALTRPQEGFKNACAIRMSYSLNYSGIPINKGAWATVSGADRKQYIYRVTDLLSYLQVNFGKADKTVKNPKPADFEGMTGILVFNVRGWDDASGHATLWDGRTCSDHCYFPTSLEASIWVLK
jgi:hypothetical protein